MNARSRLSLIAISILILLSLGGCATTETAIAVVKEKIWDYVVLGSSIGTWWAREYGSLVESDLGVNIEYHDYSVGKQPTGDLLRNVLNDEKLRADIRDAELVTIGVGFADVYFGALSPYFYMTPAEARQSIKKDSRILERKVQDFGETYDVLLDEVLKLASPSDTAIRVMDFYFPYVARYQELGIYQEIKEYWIAFSECIISSASGRNIPTARIFLLFNGATGDEDPIEKGWIAWDDLHPNEKGTELIVAEFRKLGYRYADQ